MKSVIIVDDEEDLTRSMSEYLSLMQVNVVDIAHDGKEAVEKFGIHKPNFMIVDLMMPNYDGFYVLEHIRKEDPEANIVILTGDPSEKTQERLKELNPNKIYLKPIDLDSLVNYIKN